MTVIYPAAITFYHTHGYLPSQRASLPSCQYQIILSVESRNYQVAELIRGTVVKIETPKMPKGQVLGRVPLPLHTVRGLMRGEDSSLSLQKIFWEFFM